MRLLHCQCLALLKHGYDSPVDSRALASECSATPLGWNGRQLRKLTIMMLHRCTTSKEFCESPDSLVALAIDERQWEERLRFIG